MKFALISPRLSFQKGNILGSGIPYLPLELAIFSGFLRDQGHESEVFDLFGLGTKTFEDKVDFYWQGLPIEHILNKTDFSQFDVIVVFAISFMSQDDVLHIISTAKQKCPKTPLVVLENSQAVTSFNILDRSEQLLAAGADALWCGEVYWNWLAILESIKNPSALPQNVYDGKREKSQVQRIYQMEMETAIPRWELFPLENYWELPYAHGPKTKKYLPIFTSRGCPFPCDFCVVPSFNERKWRFRKPDNIIAELHLLKASLGVSDFYIEDLNPCVHPRKTRELCQAILDANLNINFYFVSGTKAEPIAIEDVPLLAKAGCRYLSISPESGSKEVMKAIGKPFDYDHGLELIRACAANGISTQACFVLGHPKETNADFDASLAYLQKLLVAGLDEFAGFILAPVPGSQLHSRQSIPMAQKQTYVSFTPKGRADYPLLAARQSRMIRIYLLHLLKNPLKLIKVITRSLFISPKTKLENVLRRYFWLQRQVSIYRLKSCLGLTKKTASF